MFIKGFLLFAALAIVGAIPTVWFCQNTLARHPAMSDRAWVAVGIAGWVAIQLALVAYGRGTVVAVRYLDIVLLVYPVALVAVFALADRARATQFSRYAGPGAVTWLFTVVAATGVVGYYGAVHGAIDWNKVVREQAVNVEAYFATSNVDDLKAKGGRGLESNLSYPNPQRLAEILRDPDVRAILPPEMRPADADNTAARNRMWLKGMLARVTATAVHFILSIGPALLALGVSLFFAAGARRSLLARGGDVVVTPAI
jgi:hypothetical protein